MERIFNEKTWQRVRLVLALIVICHFAIRGVWRGLTASGDLTGPYSSSRAWLKGMDPYEQNVQSKVILEAGKSVGQDLRVYVTPTLYPPATLVAISPFAALRWPTARVCWLAFNLLLFASHIYALLKLTNCNISQCAGQILVLGIIGLAPFHTGLALGQPAMASIPCAVLSVWLGESDKRRLASLLLTGSCLFKPQLAAPFFLFFILRKRWDIAILAAALYVIVLSVGIGWLEWNHVPWLHSWREQASSAQAMIDPSGAMAYQLIDWRTLVAAIAPKFSDPQKFAMALGVATLALICYRVCRHGSDEIALLLAATLAIWSLLPFYHRFYDAAFLSLPWAWAIATYSRNSDCYRTRLACLSVVALCLMFFLPGAILLEYLEEKIILPPLLASSFVWRALMKPHQVWALTGVLALSLFSMFRQKSVAIPTPAYVPTNATSSAANAG